MISVETTRGVKSNSDIGKRTLLIVGPIPPPIGGSPLTVQEMIEELARNNSIRALLINTSPSRDPRKKMTGFNLEKVRRLILILFNYIRESRNCDAVLVFANNLFTFSLVPGLLMWARHHHKPFFIKPVGGDLDLYLVAKRRLFRKYLLRVLRAADGVLAQTQLLQATLGNLGCTNTHYLPGCRSLPSIKVSQKRNGDEVRLVFLGHIMRDKGPLILLEALRLLAKKSNVRVICDFYGPIHDEIHDEFSRQLKTAPSARYCGVAHTGSGTKVISGYDVLVLPTYFICEGHPGVIIEAMHAGIPVISTQHRAIPELVTNGENGILVPIRDSQALAGAIEEIALDSTMRNRMGWANYQRGQEFRTDVVITKMLKIIYPEWASYGDFLVPRVIGSIHHFTG